MGNKIRPTAELPSQRQSVSFPLDSQNVWPEFLPGKVFSSTAVIPGCLCHKSGCHTDDSVYENNQNTLTSPKIYHKSSQAEVPNWDISGKKRDAICILISYS